MFVYMNNRTVYNERPCKSTPIFDKIHLNNNPSFPSIVHKHMHVDK